MNEQKAAARRWFDRRAGSYESGVTSRWRDPVQGESLEALRLGAEDRLLDVGCGTGAASRSAASVAASVVGIDLSPEMIRQARELAAQKGNTTPFAIEPQGAVIYVNGHPGPSDPVVRQLERDIGSLTNPHDPYTGNDDEPIAAYMAGSVEQEILHLVNADPDRTPTFTVFPKPDYFFGSTVSCTPAAQAPCASNTLQSAARFAWDHGYYAPTIDITWAGFVGPGVANLGLDGPEPGDGPAIHDPDGGGTVPEFSTVGTWLDLPDIRPTILWLAGLQDSYVDDGRVLSEILTDPNDAIAGSDYTDLAECYKQLNASVGEFGTNTLIADTAALKSGGGGDGVFKSTQKILSKLLSQRDPLATELKNALFAAAFEDVALRGSGSQLGRCGAMLDRAEELVTGG